MKDEPVINEKFVAEEKARYVREILVNYEKIIAEVDSFIDRSPEGLKDRIRAKFYGARRL